MPGAEFARELSAARRAGSPGLLTRFGRFELKPHQADAARLMLKRGPGYLLYFKVGSGKTLSAIAVAENLMARGDIERVVAVMPSGLVANFKKEMRAARVDAARYWVDSFNSLPQLATGAGTRDGSASARAAKFAAFFRRNRTLLVVDEVQNLRNTGKKWHAAAIELAGECNKRLALSGTPIMNYPVDLVAALNVIEAEYEPDAEINLFDNAPNDGNNANPRRRVLSNEKLAEFANDRLRCRTLFYEPDAQTVRANYPSWTAHAVSVEMTPQQTRAHFKASRDVSNDVNVVHHFGKLKNGGIASGLVRFLHALRRICNVAFTRDGTAHSSKIHALVINVVRATTAGRKCLVYSFFRREGIDLVARILQGYGIAFAKFTGSESRQDKAEAVRAFNAGAVSVLLISRAGAEGLDLKNTGEVHIMEPGWNEEIINQVQGRAIRYGSHDGRVPRHVDVYKYYSTLPAGAANHVNSVAAVPERWRSETADEYIRTLAARKATVSNEVLTLVASVARENALRC